MLNDFAFYSCGVKADASIADAKNIFGENAPYVVDHRLEGNVIVFNTHFISMMRIALTTGCMAGMNSAEEEVMLKLVKYENGGNYRDITTNDDAVMRALDKWVSDEVIGAEHPSLSQCG